MIERAINLEGQVFGELTVLRRASSQEVYTLKNIDIKKNRCAYWWVQCNCGKGPFIVQGRNLRNGKTKSCGHLKSHLNPTRKDLKNQRFGKLTVMYYVGSSKNGAAIWHCKCDCGAEKNIESRSLISGDTKSCGCLFYETDHSHPQDLTGQYFGFLEALYPTTKRSAGHNIIWHCKCHNCGSEIEVNTSNLKRQISCGCLRSKGEFKIKQLLNKYSIPFESEKTFDTCISPITKALLKFDFYIDNKYLIEYDGEQHFFTNNIFWDTEEHLKETQYRDNIKNQWCKENNIPLIRIPYTKFNDLCIEDLLLETSNFII